jgi:hypothetical protein
LFEFLQSPLVVRTLVEANALEATDRKEARHQGLNVRWDELLADAETVTEELNRIFLR